MKSNRIILLHGGLLVDYAQLYIELLVYYLGE